MNFSPVKYGFLSGDARLERKDPVLRGHISRIHHFFIRLIENHPFYRDRDKLVSVITTKRDQQVYYKKFRSVQTEKGKFHAKDLNRT